MAENVDKILIRNLLVRGIVGLNDWERKTQQDILVNLDARLRLPRRRRQRRRRRHAELPHPDQGGHRLRRVVGPLPGRSAGHRHRPDLRRRPRRRAGGRAGGEARRAAVCRVGGRRDPPRPRGFRWWLSGRRPRSTSCSARTSSRASTSAALSPSWSASCEVEAVSGVWESDAHGAPGTPRFLNAAVRVVVRSVAAGPQAAAAPDRGPAGAPPQQPIATRRGRSTSTSALFGELVIDEPERRAAHPRPGDPRACLSGAAAGRGRSAGGPPGDRRAARRR